MVKTAFSRHFAAKQTPTQRFNSVMSSQLIHTTADQSGVGSHFGSCLALPFLHNSLQFFLLLFFYKIKTEEHSNLNNATSLCCGKFKDFSRILGNPGLFKDLP